MKKNQLFLEMILAKGLVSEDAYTLLTGKHRDDAFAILLHLRQNTPSKKNELGRLWGDSLGISYVDLKSTIFQKHVVQMLPEAFARKNGIIPIYQFGDAITAAMSDPANKQVLKDAARMAGKPVSPVFSFPDDIAYAIEVEYKTEEQLAELSNKIIDEIIKIEDISSLTRDELHKAAGSQAIVEFVNSLLLMSVRDGASDIHIQPEEDQVRIRFRIDGILREKSRLENSLLASVVSRLKILAGVDITEKRRMQDGRINLKIHDWSVDFRFSCAPTVYGEKVVLRVLGRTGTQDILKLRDLGFSKQNFDLLERVLEMPHGIFFVTGPTGSGKTTTLFSMLKALNKPGTNITTIEDPVEYRLPGITQVQVNPAVELDFPMALRGFLRQDPDVILVGEIRDTETAQIACQAALTGHMVLATLHSNNAVQAVTRLIDIGVPPFIVVPSLVGILCQRLVRKICGRCKEQYPASPQEIQDLFVWEGDRAPFYRGKGCVHCNGTGYSGRIALHEILLIDDEIRRIITRGESVGEIQRYARTSGFRTMHYDGIKKALRGLTTLEEVNRVTIAEEE